MKKIKIRVLIKCLRIQPSPLTKSLDRTACWLTTEVVSSSERVTRVSHHTRRSVGALTRQAVASIMPGRDPPKWNKMPMPPELDTTLSEVLPEGNVLEVRVRITAVTPRGLHLETTCHPTPMSNSTHSKTLRKSLLLR